jgi:hypothetical protein
MFSNAKRISISILILAGCLGAASAAWAQTERILVFQRSFVEPFEPADPARDLFNAGQNFYDQFRYADAENAFREVVKRFPKSNVADKAEYYLIRTLANSRKQSEALEHINAFRNAYPKSVWYPDVQEIRIQLTNQIPARAEAGLLRIQIPQAPPPAPAAPTPAAPVAPPQVGVRTISAERIVVQPMPFHVIPGAVQSSDPQVNLMQEAMRAMFRNDVNRALEIAMNRLKADMSDPVVLSSLDAVATSASVQAVPFLLDIAKNSPSMKARQDAIYWMSQSRGNKDAVVDALTGLFPGLTDDESDAVTFALSRISTDKAFNTLAGIARDKTKSEKLRTSALFWIGQSRSPNRVALLEDIYKNGGDNVNVRSQALFALSQTHDPQAITILGNVANSDPDFVLRKQAIVWLGQMKSPEASQALENLLLQKK